MIGFPAHPRSRGEHVIHHWGVDGQRGSSPLARGTPAIELATNYVTRLIPARAGNTGVVNAIRWIGEAHPRSRGEHMTAIYQDGKIHGSSPLARGTLATVQEFLSALRLIPARAGNTSLRRMDQGRNSAHPRSRGEHRSMPCTVRGWPGSSPLARGTPRAAHAQRS